MEKLHESLLMKPDDAIRTACMTNRTNQSNAVLKSNSVLLSHSRDEVECLESRETSPLKVEDKKEECLEEAQSEQNTSTISSNLMHHF
jgi:hypothetical protein